MYCPECDGEGVGIWNGEYVTCKYCGGTGISYESEDELWESYYEPDDKRRLVEPWGERDEWYDHNGYHGPSFSDPF